jgi:hypothetical protein
MMEYWNAGILGLAEWDLFLLGWHGAEYKIRPSSAFDSQYSIIPSFHYSVGFKEYPSGVDQSWAPWARILYL